LKHSNLTVAVLSYKFSLHPRAQRIAKALVQARFRVKAWEAPKVVRRGPRVLRGVLNYVRAIVEVSLLKADVYWIENVPDVVYLPIAVMKRRYIYDRRSPWVLHLTVEFPYLAKFSRIIGAIERFMIKNACMVVLASTPLSREFDYNAFGKDTIVIPNYPESAFKCSRDRSLRKELGIPDNVPIFLFLGKLSLVEGIDLLAKTAIALKGTGAELWIVGDGPARGIAKSLAEKYSHVRWFGWVNRGEVPQYLGSADYGLVPRRKRPGSVFYTHEGVIKIGEYLRCGLPVIASGVAPSPFYLRVDEEEFPLIVRKIALGLLDVPKPPLIPSWEEAASPRVVDVTDRCLSGGLGNARV